MRDKIIKAVTDILTAVIVAGLFLIGLILIGWLALGVIDIWTMVWYSL